MKRLICLFVLLFAFASPALADGPTPPPSDPPPCDPALNVCPTEPLEPGECNQWGCNIPVVVELYPMDMSGPDGEQGARRGRVAPVVSKFGRTGIVVR